MVFSSLTFLFAFLPASLLGHYLLPGKYRMGFLLFASLVFYAWGEPLYVFLMIFSILLNWALGLGMERFGSWKKLLLVISVAVNLALLVTFKYAGLFLRSLQVFLPDSISSAPLFSFSPRLPIGISFFTFQIMSYIIDVYRGRAQVQHSPVLFGTYVAMFPQLIAGPIVRYVDIEKQLQHPEISPEAFSEGTGLFILGLAKKVLLANSMGTFSAQFSQSPADLSILGAWTALIAMALQLYFDFSGYSDMACGLGRMLGFRFVRNFDYPYISQSFTEYWRRWHISLGTWFREYVYYPLGGNRRGKARQILNILIVWSLTGLWHGAEWSFLIWGLYHAFLLILEKLFLLKALKAAPRFLRHVYTLFFLVINSLIFSGGTLSWMLTWLSVMFVPGTAPLLSPVDTAWILGYLPWFLVCFLGSTPVPRNLALRFQNRTWSGPVRGICLSLLFLLSVAALTSRSYNPFIYFRF